MWGLATWLWLMSLSLRWGMSTDLPWGNVQVLGPFPVLAFSRMPDSRLQFATVFLAPKASEKLLPSSHPRNQWMFCFPALPCHSEPKPSVQTSDKALSELPSSANSELLCFAAFAPPQELGWGTRQAAWCTGWEIQGGDWKDWLAGTPLLPDSARPNDICEMVARFARTSLLKGGRATMVAWSQATHRQFKRGNPRPLQCCSEWWELSYPANNPIVAPLSSHPCSEMGPSET